MRKNCPLLIQLGSRIRELRKAQKFSQESFADKVGLDRTYMGGIERGERNVATVNLARIAVALKIDIGELFPTVDKLEDILKQ